METFGNEERNEKIVLSEIFWAPPPLITHHGLLWFRKIIKKFTLVQERIGNQFLPPDST
jgi:hypothetical protein